MNRLQLVHPEAFTGDGHCVGVADAAAWGMLIARWIDRGSPGVALQQLVDAIAALAGPPRPAGSPP
jgi:hypothetical protein